MTITIADAELDRALERQLESRKPPIEQLSEVEMLRSRNKEEAAWFLGITERQLETWMRRKGDRGGLGCPHMKPAHSVSFTYAALAEWRKQFEVK
ncbi:MAG: hypothetical protein JWL59_3660 [Chthoniobacteraceae bacterium]|nr:hypothetical protein [Chthoniobacteraceae bacterium]